MKTMERRTAPLSRELIMPAYGDQRSSPNRKIDNAMMAKIILGVHAAIQAGITPERPSDEVSPKASQ